MSDGGFYDSEELRKQVIDLKLRLLELDKEKVALLKDCEGAEKANVTLKQELVILESMAELRPSDFEEEVAPEGGTEGEKEFKRFADANRLLETQILNAEISAVLPRLEKEALELESGIFAHEKAAKQASEAQDEAPSLYQKTASELEEEMGEVIEKRIKVKLNMTKEAENKRREKALLNSQIARQRDVLLTLIDEREAMQTAANDALLSLRAEEARIDVLVSHHVKTRNTITAFNKEGGGDGWEQEAFHENSISSSSSGGGGGGGGGGGEDVNSHSNNNKQPLLRSEDLPYILRAWLPATADLRTASINMRLAALAGNSSSSSSRSSGGGGASSSGNEEEAVPAYVDYALFKKLCAQCETSSAIHSTHTHTHNYTHK